MKLNLKSSLFTSLCIGGLLVLASPTFAQDTAAEPARGYCVIANNNPEKPRLNCADRRQRFPRWRSHLRAECESWCQENSPASEGRGLPLEASAIVIPNQKPQLKPNTAWVTAFEKGGYKSQDVYTDLYVKSSTRITRAGVGCEKYSRAGAFINNLFGTLNIRKLDIALIVSEADLGEITPANLKKARDDGMVYSILSYERSVDGSSCKAKNVTSGDGRIARVRADISKPLHLSLVYLQDWHSDPAKALSSGADENNQATKFVGTVLNGALSQYGADLRFLADHLKLERQTLRVQKSPISVFPLNERSTERGDHNKVIFDVVIDDESIAKIEVFQNPQIPQLGSLTGQTSLNTALKQTYVADGGRRTKQEALWNLIGPSKLPALTASGTFEDWEKVVAVCNKMSGFFGQYEFPNHAMERLKALLLKEFVTIVGVTAARATLANHDDAQACLSQDQRREHADLIPQLILGGAVNRQTCMSVASVRGVHDHDLTTLEVVDATLREFNRIGENNARIELRKGNEFDGIKVESGAAQGATEVAQSLDGRKLCYFRANKYDTTTSLPNPTCNFLFSAATRSNPDERFWVNVQAETVFDGVPKPVTVTVGEDISRYVTKESATLRSDCEPLARDFYKRGAARPAP